MKKLIIFLVVAIAALWVSIVSAAPTTTFQKNVFPETNNLFDLGSALKVWKTLYVNTVCLAGDCQSSWPAGGAGSKFVTTSINYLSSTQFTFVGAGGISIATSPPGTVSFTMTETDPIFTSYPASATNTFVSKNTASTTAWNTAYFNASTSRENPLTFSSGLQRTGDSVVNSGVTSLNSQTGAVTLNLEFLSATNTNVTGTVAQFNFTNATGTLLKIETILATTGTYGYGNFTAVTSTGLQFTTANGTTSTISYINSTNVTSTGYLKWNVGAGTTSTITYLNFQNATGTRILTTLFNFTSGTSQFLNVQNVTSTGGVRFNVMNGTTSSITYLNTQNITSTRAHINSGGLTVTGGTTLGNVTSTSLTTTNLYVSGSANISGLSFTSTTIPYLNSTNVTTSRLNVLNSLSLPNNSVTDAMISSAATWNALVTSFNAYPAIATSTFVSKPATPSVTSTFQMNTAGVTLLRPLATSSITIGFTSPSTTYSKFKKINNTFRMNRLVCAPRVSTTTNMAFAFKLSYGTDVSGVASTSIGVYKVETSTVESVFSVTGLIPQENYLYVTGQYASSSAITEMTCELTGSKENN